MEVEQRSSLSSGNCVHLLTAFCHRLYLCVSSELHNKQSLLLSRILTVYSLQPPRKVPSVQQKLNVYTLVILFVFFYCCLSVHVDNYTIIIPTKCTSFLLLKAQDITICTLVFVFLAPTCFNPRDMQQHLINHFNVILIINNFS
jgi:hypothetical protein